jgi:hypothetical protein
MVSVLCYIVLCELHLSREKESYIVYTSEQLILAP